MVQDAPAKNVIVTGGASGIGLATVKALAQTGAYVTILDVNEATGNEVLKDFQSAGHHVQFVKCDVTDWDSQVAGFKAAIKYSPSETLDTVITSAGIQDSSRIMKQAMAEPPSLDKDPTKPSMKVIDINLVGVYYSTWLACHYFQLNAQAPQESKPLEKSVVLIASTAGYIDFPNAASPYWTSKWGVRGLFASIRHDVKKVGARINLIAPYYVKTALLHDHSMEPPGGWAEIEDVAKTIVKCVTDTSVDGLAFAIFPPKIGVVDLGDNFEGAWAGTKLREVSARLLGAVEKPPFEE